MTNKHKQWIKTCWPQIMKLKNMVKIKFFIDSITQCVTLKYRTRVPGDKQTKNIKIM